VGFDVCDLIEKINAKAELSTPQRKKNDEKINYYTFSVFFLGPVTINFPAHKTND
jgi:hypothetical protein